LAILVVSAFTCQLLIPSQISAQDGSGTRSGQHSGEESTDTVPSRLPIVIHGDPALRWTEGTYDCLVVPSSLVVMQGDRSLRARSGVLWIEWAKAFSNEPHKMIAYLEGLDAMAQGEDSGQPASTASSHSQKVSLFSTTGELQLHVESRVVEPRTLHPLYARGIAYRTAQRGSPAPEVNRFQDIQLAQFTQPIQVAPPPTPPILPPAFGTATNPTTVSSTRRIRIEKRGSTPLQTSSFPSPDGREQITVVDSGVKILVYGDPSLGTIDIEADRIVVWSARNFADLTANSGAEAGGAPVEFYLEGNIIFRQGNNLIQAASMYYNVSAETGVVLDADLLTPLRNYQGLVRLKASVLRQIDRNRFQAYNAAVTTSRLGVPRYWFESGTLTYEDPTLQGFGGSPTNPANPFLPAAPPVTGPRQVTSRDNYVYLAGIPVLYWPTIRTDFTRPTTYINRVRIGSDRVFGRQFGLGFDMDEIFGLKDRFPGVDWTVSGDYLSERGFGFGTNVEYEVGQFLGIPGPSKGFLDAWGINDNGLDNLGADRRTLTPEEEFRGRVLWNHRQQFLNGWQATAELGYISDRNFLEQYYEREWDEQKDQLTGLELKYLTGSSSWNIAGYGQLNDFFTQTEWLPRFDQFQLGEGVFGNYGTWFGHSHVGYAQLQPATRPVDPVDAAKFNPLAWERDVQGVRAGGRHELDFPIEAGVVKIVPFAIGEVTYWGQDLNGDDLTRLMGQGGVRASLPMWSIDPNIQSVLWNLNGLAHKVVFEANFLYADADENLDRLPLYDPLDDDNTEHFRRRFVDDTFGGLANVDDLVPLKFDERFFAFRSAMQSWVTAASPEIADDLMVAQLGVRQRWQTKRGVPGSFRLVDWMTFDIGTSLFPEPDRDNFGEVAGMLHYDYRWHVGDRVTLASDGFADVFGDGLRTVSIGTYITRPTRGSMYVGVRSIEGPISSNLLNFAVNYRMSPKWIGTAGTVIDFGRTGNIGQTFELTRIGESFLVSVGARVDNSRNNVGFGFTVEPRFLPATYRGRVGGIPLAPAGAYGLE
jgi:LPS transport system D